MATTLSRPSTITYAAARARWATVRIETDGSIYVGRVYVPETKKRLSDVLCDDRPFVNLTEVSINDSDAVEPFVAVNKRFIKTVRVLHDGDSDVVPIRGRVS
jgi:hypothetical protein